MSHTTAELERHPFWRGWWAPPKPQGGDPLRRPMSQDVLLAGVLTATSLVGVLVHLHVDLPEGVEEGSVRTLDTRGILLVLLQTVPLAWRRKAPVLVLGVATSALFLYSVSGYLTSFAALGVLVALYTTAAYRERRLSAPAGVAAGVVFLLILLVRREPLEPDAILAEGLIVGAAWVLGDGLRIRRDQVLMLEDRASRLERDREEQAHRAVAQERRVIARELHDVVAHNVSVIVAQAGAANQISSTQPEEALTALASIEHTGREALVEMRRIMGLLRPDADDDTDRAPQPGLHQLDELLQQVREAGVPVRLVIEGEPRPLPLGLELSAYRIVQEALTNVLKHAGAAGAHVLVSYRPMSLELTITDDGAGVSPDATRRMRYGHLGMRERVALFGGELRAGPMPGGGYRVEASLPTDQEPR